MKRLPPGWTRSSIGELGEVRSGRQRSPHKSGIARPYLRVANVFDGHIDFSDVLSMPFKDDEFLTYELRPGDILLNEGQSLELVGRAAIFEGRPEKYAFQNTLVRFRPACPEDATFYYLLFQHLRHTGVLASIAVQTTSIAHLGSDRFADLVVPIPPPPVRQKIAEIGTAWNRGLEKLRQLLRAHRKLRDGLAAELLTGRRRVPGFALSSWREVRLGDITRESVRRNGERLGTDRVMAVTKSVGLTPMRDRTMSDSLTRYKVLRPGGFAYNPMRLNIGSIARSSFNRDVLVSPDYVVFEAVPESLDPRFLDYIRRAHAWRRFMMAAGSGGVRIRIYYDDLARMKLKLPNREEQSAIANVLDAAFQELACLAMLRDAVTKQKRGLMQGLLTGKIRLKEDSHG